MTFKYQVDTIFVNKKRNGLLVIVMITFMKTVKRNDNEEKEYK